MKDIITFHIRQNHKNHKGEALIVDDYNEGTIIALNHIPGNMDDLKTNFIGISQDHNIYENYYDSGSDNYFYFAVKNQQQ